MAYFYKHIALFKEYLPEKTSAYILKKGPEKKNKSKKVYQEVIELVRNLEIF